MSDRDIGEFKDLTEAEELRKIVSDLQTKLFKEKDRTAKVVQAARDGMKDAMVILGNPPPVETPKPDRRQGKAEVAVLHLSDWQLGKRTESYSSDICEARIERLGDKVEEMVAIERSAHPVDEIHALLGGDLIEGSTIFPGQQYEIDATSFQQIGRGTTLLERTLRRLCGNFPKVVVWEVEGNHGRHGKKGENPREDNADLFIYDQVRQRLDAAGLGDRVEWHTRERWYRIIEIGNYHALLVHGDQVKAFGGNLPSYGIARKVNAWVSGVIERRSSSGEPLVPFTDCYMGHFHQPLVIPLANGKGRTFINPSVESDSMYAQEFVAASGTPGQRLHFVEPVRGRVTTERMLWLDD